MTAAQRAQRADAADALCSAAFARALEGRRGAATTDESGMALVAVGGYGRRELAPHSDLDVVLVHTEDADVDEVAAQVWYPLWDAGATVDHAVRALQEVAEAAKQDVRVALGLLDARHLAGDTSVTLRLRSALLAQWRRHARERLPELRHLVERRVERLGELAHSTVPDLKESGGGLRDATILNALVATWLVDVPHSDLEPSRLALLDVRDALHAVAGRASDRIGPEMWPDLAAELGHDGAEATQRLVRELGRRTTHISRLTWRRVEGVLSPRSAPNRRTPGPVMEPLGHGLATTAGEVVVQRRSGPADLSTLLRAAAVAAERDLILSPPTAARLVREAPDLPEPWPAETRELLVRLLAAGPGLLPVWETLDETGALTRLLPEWERVRLLPHASVVHRFTVDRHLVETCIEASRLIRRVPRPDLLVVAALVHDIGKGELREHSVAGEPIAAALARRIGFSASDAAVIASLVRHHLLLAEVATTRDPEDPATVEHVLGQVSDPMTFDLLAALTEADARATSAKAWTPWRSGLVESLVERVRAVMHEGPAAIEPAAWERPIDVPPAVLRDSSRVDVHVEEGEHGCEVTVVTGDRSGVLAAISGAFGVLRLPIRSARAWTQDRYAVSQWQVDDGSVDAAVVRNRVEAVFEGRLDPGARLRRRTGDALDPSVAVRPEASRRATVIEVRMADQPGVVHRVCQALAEIGISVRSAHVATVGPQAVDVFYVQEESAGALGDERAAQAAHAVREALGDPGYP
ncbi:MAG TPA: [protein-PII] uridylyltransferase [Nocardioidaceae bacterium]|nr:[protein-PII] uridylyltransferase [Nocardioidaceae bacterium]